MVRVAAMGLSRCWFDQCFDWSYVVCGGLLVCVVGLIVVFGWEFIAKSSKSLASILTSSDQIRVLLLAWLAHAVWDVPRAFSCILSSDRLCSESQTLTNQRIVSNPPPGFR